MTDAILRIANRLVFWRLYHASKPTVRLTACQRDAIEEFQNKIRIKEYRFESTSCICGRETGSLIARYDRYGLDLDTYLCSRCGTLWTNPRLDSDSLTQFYKNDYRKIYVGENYASEAFWEQQKIHGQRILRFVNNSIQVSGKATVFDIGCGAGGTLVPFRSNGWKVYGCDLGSEYLERGLDAGLALECGDESALRQYRPADLLIYSHVVEHLVDPKASLKKARSLLRDGGYVYIELPGIQYIDRSYRDTRLFLQNAHLFHFTLSTLTSLLASMGFELIEGDESIRAIYKKVPQPSKVEVKSQCLRVWLYLAKLEVHWYLPFIVKSTRYVRRRTQDLLSFLHLVTASPPKD